MKTIVVVNTKGGAGKTTIATNLASALASRFRVLVIDADQKQESSACFFELRKSTGMPQADCVKGTVDMLFKNLMSFSQYDYVVIDAGAGETDLVRAAIIAGRYGMLLLPTQASALDVWATEDTLKLLEQCRALLPGSLEKVYIVLNRVNSSANITKEAGSAVEELCERFSVGRFKVMLHDRTAYKEAIGEGLNAIEFKGLRKKLKSAASAAAEIHDLTTEVLEHLEGR